jgi:hypothetical protein
VVYFWVKFPRCRKIALSFQGQDKRHSDTIQTIFVCQRFVAHGISPSKWSSESRCGSQAIASDLKRYSAQQNRPSMTIKPEQPSRESQTTCSILGGRRSPVVDDESPQLEWRKSRCDQRLASFLHATQRFVVEGTPIDNATVPEPATLAIWGLGALGCAIAGYRRRKRA